jgi:beta-mannosidase
MKDDSLNFFVVSDSLTNVNADLVVKLVDFNGKISFQKSFPVEIKANSSFDYVRLDKNEFENLDESKMVLTAELNSEGKVLAKNSFFFKEPKDLDLEKPDIKISTVRNSSGYEFKLSTNKFAKDVYLSFNSEKGFFTDNYFDLLPGEAKVIELKTDKEINDIQEKIKIISLIDSY